jgi:hypothetical protein
MSLVSFLIQVRSSAMLLLSLLRQIVTIAPPPCIYDLGILQCHKIRTKIRENQLTALDFKNTDTQYGKFTNVLTFFP